MTELQAMTYALLLFIAHRIVNPANARDAEFLKKCDEFYRKLLESGEDE